MLENTFSFFLGFLSENDTPFDIIKCHAHACLSSTLYCDNIMGVAWVYWIIYSRGVVQYIQRREAPRDILLNPEGVYSPIYPCQAHYIITIKPIIRPH